MRKSIVFSLFFLFLVVIVGFTSNRPEAARKKQPQSRIHLPIHNESNVVAHSAASTDTFVLAEFDFEGVSGPDPQGWVSVDLTEQSRFWHVDTFMVPAAGGNQAMWCGARPDTVGEVGGYECLPGYGNDWIQILETPDPFTVEGDVTWSFDANWDIELYYDEIRPEFLQENGLWAALDFLDGTAADSTLSYVIPASYHGGSIRLRLRFLSDEAWSDEDCKYDSNGAIQVDNIVVADTTGVLHVEDFEDEALDSQETDDGVWVATVKPFGDYADLLDASDLFLPTSANESYVWGFTHNSPYTCAGSYNCEVPCGPDTLHVVPGREGNDEKPYLTNEVWSPVIDWTHDIYLNPVDPAATKTILQFRVYRNLTFYGGIFYSWGVRSNPTGSLCTEMPWRGWETGYGSQGDWLQFTKDISDSLEAGVEELQISLGVRDVSWWTCPGIPECGDCLTPSPLFDDVRIIRVIPTGTGIEDTPEFENMLEANYPNPFNPGTTIRYSIKERAHVTLKIYDVSGRLVRTLVDERQSPQGIVPITWDGTNDNGQGVSSGVYFYRLVTKGFVQTKKMVLLR